VKVVDVRRTRVEDAVELAARTVFAGGTVVYSDETGYLLAADVMRDDAAEAVYGCARAADSVVVSIASASELLEYLGENQLANVAVKRLAPETVSFLVPCPTFWKRARATSETVAMRVPSDGFAQALLERCGPLIGCATSYTGVDLEGLPKADVVLERGEVVSRREASVVDLRGDRARLVVEASATYERLAARLGSLEDSS
jgi:tRNA A37 threonylcarbamoyladenosine synthetase subunit TsaC/SUA5/YrdC